MLGSELYQLCNIAKKTGEANFASDCRVMEMVHDVEGIHNNSLLGQNDGKNRLGWSTLAYNRRRLKHLTKNLANLNSPFTVLHYYK